MTDNREDTETDVRLTADVEDGADELRSLRAWLSDVDEVRGHVELAEGPPVAGTLGPAVDALLVMLGPGGAATALATALVTWIRHRRSEVTLKVERRNGTSFELSAKRVRLLDGGELRQYVDEVTAMLSAAADEPAPGQDADASSS